MDKHRASIVNDTDTHCRRLVSPLGITLVDGDQHILGQVIYQVDLDEGLPFVYDEQVSPIYDVWKGSLVPALNQRGSDSVYLCVSEKGEEPMQGCYLRGCRCNSTRTSVIKFLPVQNRTELASKGEHWLQEEGSDSEMYPNYDHYNESCLNSRITSLRTMRGMRYPGKDWKSTWIADPTTNNPSFSHKCSADYVESNRNKGLQTPSLLAFPLEVYEVLVAHLDGSSFINLANASKEVEERVLEPFLSMPQTKKELKWYNYCSRDLNRATITKILSSFDIGVGRVDQSQIEEFEFGNLMETLTWEKIFMSYKNYWHLLVNSAVKVETLSNYESRLKAEALILQEELRTPEKEKIDLIRMTRSGGGRILYNVLFPFPQDEQNPLNLTIVEDCEKANCRHVAPICMNTTSPSRVKVKVVQLLSPVGSQAGTPPKPPPVNKVLVSVCDNCICLTRLQGGNTRIVNITEEVETEDQFIKMDPIMEVQDNIVAVWLHPGYLLVFMVIPKADGTPRTYDICRLYRLQAPQMRCVWNHVATHQSDYLPIIREYKGSTNLLSDDSKRLLNEGCSEPTYYGLALISPIYGIECFKPAESADPDSPSTVIESIPPQYYLKNGRKYLPTFRESPCSGKGHGLFVFCNDKAIAVSWNGINWIFGPLTLPMVVQKKHELRNVVHVDVISDNGLLLVVNDNILLVELTLLTNPPDNFVYNGVNISEPELELKVMRVFSLGLAPLLMELTHVEIDFDQGRPFLFIVAEKKVKVSLVEGKRTKWEWDDLSFRMKRIDFL